MNTPAGWTQATLGKECSIEIGGTPSRDVHEFWDTDSSTENAWVSIRDMHSRVITDTAERISDLGVRHSNVKLQPEGTVLLSFKLTIGRVAFSGVPLYTNEAIAGLRSKTIDSEYLYHGLHQWDLLQGVDQAIKGATLNKAKLKKLSFVYPKSRDEQSTIAKVLSAVDQAIAQTKSLIAKQRRIKTGMMKDLLTRGLDEHGQLRSEATHAFQDSPLGRIPMEWEVMSLGAALDGAKGYLQTGPFGSQLHAHEYTHVGVPVIMPQDILQGFVSTAIIARIPEARAHDLRRHRVIENDIVFSRRGDLSRAAAIGSREVGWLCGTGCFLLRVPPKNMSARWLAYLYRHHWIQRQIETNAVGSTMPSLNNGVMAKLVLPFPAVGEQRKISQRIDAMDNETELLEAQLNKQQSIKTALMQDLLSGKVRVTPLLKTVETVSA